MDSTPSHVSISNFPGDFSNPIEPDEFDAPRDAYPQSIPQMGDSYLPFDEATKKLEGLLGFNLKLDQKRALEKLYMGSDLCLIAATGFGKTIVFILQPLKRIMRRGGGLFIFLMWDLGLPYPKVGPLK